MTSHVTRAFCETSICHFSTNRKFSFFPLTNKRVRQAFDFGSFSHFYPDFILSLLRFCHRKAQIDVSCSCICPVIDNEFHHIMVKEVCRSTRHSYFDNDMTKFVINNRKAARKTDVNLLILQLCA